MTLDTDDYRAFLEKVDEQCVDEFAEELFGHDAQTEVQLPDTVTKVELHQIISALITAHNEANERSEFFDCVMYHRLIRTFVELDEDVQREYRDAQEQQHPFVAMFGAMGEEDFEL